MHLSGRWLAWKPNNAQPRVTFDQALPSMPPGYSVSSRRPLARSTDPTASRRQVGKRVLDPFWVIIAVLLLLSASIAHNPVWAMWFGFLLAGYSAVANDSIQTLGTFIASNHKAPWWLLWLFVAGIFVLTSTYSFLTFDGDVSYQRLSAKGFDTAPTEFTILQVAAPIVLLVLTRFKVPVSTTFLLLSCFATSSKGVWQVISKSVGGYLLAFTVAAVAWVLITRLVDQWSERPAHPAWRLAQWLSTGFLWSVWLMQDAANIAVYLPRQLDGAQFFVYAGFLSGLLALLMARRGGRIQEVVREKSSVTDVRSATMIDLVYAFILLFFKMYSKIPMSTTWVFVGLLAGRELGRLIAHADWSRDGTPAGGRLGRPGFGQSEFWPGGLDGHGDGRQRGLQGRRTGDSALVKSFRNTVFRARGGAITAF